MKCGFISRRPAAIRGRWALRDRQHRTRQDDIVRRSKPYIDDCEEPISMNRDEMRYPPTEFAIPNVDTPADAIRASPVKIGDLFRCVSLSVNEIQAGLYGVKVEYEKVENEST